MTELYDEIANGLNDEYPCRSAQVRQLLYLLPTDTPTFPALIFHGLANTAKSALTSNVLRRTNTLHALIRCQECVTGRHLLETTVKACIDAVELHSEDTVDRSRYTRCENINALFVHLQRLLVKRGKFVLVFDGIDRQREAQPTLLPALIRLNETIPSVTTVFIVTSPSTAHRPLYHATLPHVGFPTYTRAELLQIVSRDPPPVFETLPSPEVYDLAVLGEDTLWLWTKFLAAVYDSVGRAVARDCVSFRTIAERLWIPFVQGIRDGSFGTRDFSRLVVAKRALFQGEEGLTDSADIDVDEGNNYTFKPNGNESKLANTLPPISKFLLIAAYLASFNPPRTDAVLLMRYNADKKRKRKQNMTAAGSGNFKSSKYRKIPRRLLHPGLFNLERLLAIFHSIRPEEGRSAAAVQTQSAEILTHVATLTGLRLLLKAGTSNSDVLDAGTAKWRVNVGWEIVVGVARSVNFEIGDFVVE